MRAANLISPITTTLEHCRLTVIYDPLPCMPEPAQVSEPPEASFCNDDPPTTTNRIQDGMQRKVFREKPRLDRSRVEATAVSWQEPRQVAQDTFGLEDACTSSHAPPLPQEDSRWVVQQLYFSVARTGFLKRRCTPAVTSPVLLRPLNGLTSEVATWPGNFDVLHRKKLTNNNTACTFVMLES